MTPLTKLKLLAYFFLVIITSSCDVSDNEVVPGESFQKIYDNSSFNASFIPIDIVQTEDKGFLILGSTRLESSNFTGVYLMKVDENGEFVQEQNLSEEFVNPVKSIITIEKKHYFVAMKNLQANLFEVDGEGNLAEPIELTGITYPLALGFDGIDKLILQSYNHDQKNAVISLMNTTGTTSLNKAFTIGSGEGVEAPVIQHFNRTGRQFPFSVGRMATGQFYFNGFYDHTFSLAFTDLVSDEVTGVAQGQQDDSGISAVVPLTGSEFAIARFSFGDNYIQPKVNINPGDFSSSVDLEGNLFPELVPDAPVVLKKLTIAEKETLLYASDTKDGRIVLLAYDPTTEALTGTKYLGFSNPYRISSFIPTEDGGLAVLATTAVVGRFDRFSLFKLSKAELEELVK